MSSLPTVAISDIADVNPTTSISHLVVASFVGMEDVSESFALTRTSDRDVSASRGYTRFREGDLLFAKITPCMENGKGAHASGLTNGIGFGSTEFHVLRARSGEPRFLAQWLQAKDLRLAAEAQMTGSAGQRRVPTDFFSRYRIPSLPIPEQCRIAEILDTLDDQIRTTEKVIAKLKIIKQGALDDFMTRGVSDDGVIRPRTDQAPLLYSADRSGVRPKAWTRGLLDNFATRGSGHTPNKNVPSFWNGGIKWVSLADSSKLDQLYITNTDKEISGEGIANSSAVIHPAGTVILSRDAGVGKSSILAEDMAVSQHFMAWRVGPKLSNFYLYYWLQYMKREFEAIAMGSTIKTIRYVSSQVRQ
ncbi:MULTISPECIES: restriction endonuclease subunit S [Rhodococcus]|jgi:type I restriction enzyme S subunit|nr:restriction endonuclease subunit S [Rhodococcus erythropolis]UKO86531.1 restriction endonuclease subunit S [Rhodococcus erythropolis]BBE48921.1 hypothetical protein RE2895_58520 [Rhodococcus erythropolis]